MFVVRSAVDSGASYQQKDFYGRDLGYQLNVIELFS